ARRCRAFTPAIPTSASIFGNSSVSPTTRSMAWTSSWCRAGPNRAAWCTGTSDTCVAAPAYWAAHGVPQRPKDLERHNCLLTRGVTGPVVDLWSFERDGETESVVASGWLVTDNASRRHCGGRPDGRVVRIIDLPDYRAAIRAGRLVPVLADWPSSEVPPVNLM